jgi:hypothetical protein
MEFHLRIAEILGISAGRSHGLITRIARGTGLNRGQVSNLIFNRCKSFNKKHLEKIAAYLVEQGLIEERELPGVLFGQRPDDFWKLISGARRVELCLGWRKSVQPSSEKYVMLADSQLLAQLVYRMTGPPGPGWHDDPQRRAGQAPLLKQHSVPAPATDGSNEPKIQREARKFYREFTARRDDKALILLGSGKSNPLVDLSVSHCFVGARPFRSQDDVEHAARRSCPFVFIYRPTDPKPQSVCGGLQLSVSETGAGAGIHYETADGRWRRCAWDANSDAALVLYRFERLRGHLEMVLGGYTSRGTRCLSEFLATDAAHQLWPPTYSDSALDVGVFVLQFRFRGRPPSASDGDARPGTPEVTRLDRDVIARRLRRPRATGAHARR